MLYTHCYAHASNLAVADAIKSVKCISDSLDRVREIRKLVKHKVRQNKSRGKNESRGVHAFCPSRWTVRGEVLAADKQISVITLNQWNYGTGR